MATVKETREVLALAKALPAEIASMLVDGKIDWKDIPKIASLWVPAKAALEGIGQVPVEMQDLDAAEIQALVSDAIAVGQAWIALVTHLSQKSA